MQNLIDIPREETLMLDKLEELLSFGAEKLSKIHTTSITVLRLHLLMEMVGAVHNYSEAIVLLIRGGKKEAAIVILRSLVETLINVQYVLSDSSEIHAAEFVLDDEYDRKRFMTKLKAFAENNPKYQNLVQSYMSQQSPDDFITERANTIAQEESKQKRKIKLPKRLEERAKVADTAIGNPSLEFMYLTIYWYFSTYAHLTARGLNNFIDQTDNRNTFIIGTNTRDIRNLLISTFAVYLGFLGEANKYFGLPSNEELKDFEDYFSSLVNVKS